MGVTPAKDEFLSRVRDGAVPPICIGPVTPPCDPPTAFAAIRDGGYGFLLESVRPDPKTGRYSFAGAAPYMVMRARRGEVEIETGSGTLRVEGRKPLAVLRELMGGYKAARADALPPFAGGCAGYFSYDFVHNFENLPYEALDDLGIPDACFVFVDTLAAFDHIEGKFWLIANPGASMRRPDGMMQPEIDWGTAYDESAAKLVKLRRLLADAKPAKRTDAVKPRGITAVPLVSKKSYKEMVARAKEYIAAGDIFQANLSQRLSADVSGIDPWDIYLVLRDVNPSPFAGFLDFPGVAVASSSPERLVRVSKGTVDTRPIAGTRPRGKDAGGDEAMRSELLLNEKERAEHIMLIDLERNDLGRVCYYGSVMVDEFMATEDYSHVIHIVSNVTGTLAAGRDAFDVIRATFPGGTITGVPKVRCMEIIDELEPVTRGPYTGSIGYIAYTGDMDLNIVIRTFVIKDGVAYVQAGGGIVADSDPEREYYETLHKAEALIRTLEKL